MIFRPFIDNTVHDSFQVVLVLLSIQEASVAKQYYMWSNNELILLYTIPVY